MNVKILCSVVLGLGISFYRSHQDHHHSTMAIAPNSGAVPHQCVTSSVELLTTFVQAPIQSNICLLRIQNALDCVKFELQSQRGNFGVKAKFAFSHPALLRYGTRFLTRSDTTGKYKEMISYFSRCQCQCDFDRTETWNLHMVCDRVAFYLNDSKEIHEPIIRYTELPDPETLVSNLADLISNLMNLSLSRTPPNEFHKEKITHNKKCVQKWPQNAQDLLPFGIEKSIRALTIWATESPTLKRSFVWVIAVPLAIVYDQFCIELFQFSSDNFKYDLAFHLPIQHIDYLLNEYAEDLRRAEKQASSKTEPTWRLIHFYDGIHQTWSMIDHAKGSIDVTRRCRFLTMHDETIRPVLHRLGSVLSHSNENFADPIRHLQRGLDQLELCGPRGMAINPSTGEIYIADRALWVKIEERYDCDYLGDDWSALLRARFYGCLFSGCPKPELETKNARVCARCGFVRYCSQDVSVIHYSYRIFEISPLTSLFMPISVSKEGVEMLGTSTQ